MGYQTQHGRMTKIGGWGFPHDDEGGGAWLGLQAMRVTLQWMDGRLPPCGLAEAIYAHFAQDQRRLVTWANQANSTAFAELAPFVIQQAQAGDSVAITCMQQAAQAIDKMGVALLHAQSEKSEPLPCALIGGVAHFLEPYLSKALRARLRPCQATPDVGAIIFVRHHLTEVSKRTKHD